MGTMRRGIKTEEEDEEGYRKMRRGYRVFTARRKVKKRLRPGGDEICSQRFGPGVNFEKKKFTAGPCPLIL